MKGAWGESKRVPAAGEQAVWAQHSTRRQHTVGVQDVC